MKTFARISLKTITNMYLDTLPLSDESHSSWSETYHQFHGLICLHNGTMVIPVVLQIH
jgi:hypothetical protein